MRMIGSSTEEEATPAHIRAVLVISFLPSPSPTAARMVSASRFAVYSALAASSSSWQISTK